MNGLSERISVNHNEPYCADIHPYISLQLLYLGGNLFFWLDYRFSILVSFIDGENQSTLKKPPTCRKSLTNFNTYCCIKCTMPWTGLELTTLVVIGTDCTGSCKSNYHTTTTVPWCLNNMNIIPIKSYMKLWKGAKREIHWIFFIRFVANARYIVPKDSTLSILFLCCTLTLIHVYVLYIFEYFIFLLNPSVATVRVFFTF